MIEKCLKNTGLFFKQIPKDKLNEFELIHSDLACYWIISNYTLDNITNIKDSNTYKNLIIRSTKSDGYYHIVSYNINKLDLKNHVHVSRAVIALPDFLEKKLFEIFKDAKMLNQAQSIFNMIND